MNRSVLFLLGITLLLLPHLASAQTNTASWIQRANQGPETPKSATSVWYSLDSTRLRIVLVVDSTGPSNYIYMILQVPKYRGEGEYKLVDGLTIYQYGNRADQKTVCDYGSFTVTAIDSITNVVTANFSWSGTANLQNGITLTQKISSGVLTLQIKPDMVMVPKPGSGAKFKTDKDIALKVYARDLYNLNRFFPGVEVTLTHGGIAFEGEKTLKVVTDADGAATFNLHTRENAVEGDYSYKVKGTKIGITDSPELTVNFTIDKSGRYYYTKCLGVSNTEFDAGEGKKWEGEEGSSTITASGDHIRLAGLLALNGTVVIDTSGGSARVTGQGDVYFEGVWFDGLLQPFYLYRGPITFFVPSCEGAIDFTTSALATELTGGKLKTAKLRFLGDGVTSSGAEITCGMELPENAKEGCNDEVPFGTVWAPNKKAEAELTLGFIKGPSQTDFTASGTIKNFSPVANWCVKETKLEYKSASSEFSISGKGKSPFFESVSAGMVFKSGTLNGLNVDFELATCVPVPETPLCWKGGGFKVENLQIGNPLKGSVNAKFGPLATQADRLFELTIEGGFEDPPAKVYGKVTGNFLKVPEISKDKPFQCEVSGTGTAEFGTKNTMTLELTGSALHFGGDYFFTGKFTGALGFTPLMVSESLDGSLTFPKLSDDNAKKLGLFGKFINGYAPILLGKASGSIVLTDGGPNTLSMSYDMSNLVPPTQENAEVYKALRDLGRGSVKVDLDALPNPSALEFDGGFKNLLSGWFSNVTKNGDAVQAADVSFTVADGQEAFMSVIESGSANLASHLVDPDGTSISAANPDRGVHYLHSADGLISMWVVKNPKPGVWKLSAPNAMPTDTFAIQATIPAATLELQTSIDGNNLVIAWTGNNLPESGALSFFTVDAQGVKARRPIGSATVRDNSVSIPLTDSTAPCSFTVTGILADATANLTVDASSVLSNPAMTLLPPTNARATSDQNGKTTVSWDPVTDGRVAAVVVYDAVADTVITAAYNFENQVTVVLANTEALTLALRTVDKRSLSSCPTQARQIVTDVQDLGPASQTQMDGITSTVRPHPVTGTATIDVAGLGDSPAILQVVDITGRVVVEQTLTNIVEGASSVTLGTQGMPNGMYVLTIRQGARILSQSLFVTH